ncbi:aspartate kinase [Chamaesiphon sp. OTE_20_metabat_361]|uniref:aspartate kinase n=1 Tax=Chamaesiphon sp. OTE_20_metabat_361 TaxID=2964689 RepID=UPI00286BA8AE|nr:aspartate kinase [Chamaesiphon sp. OTE_20_metabat_361]
MALIVQKYGGTSVGDAERIQAVARRVVAAVKAGNELVVVVSAMGKTTDGLVKLARELSSQPSRREMDMLLATGEQVTIALLSIAIQELGQSAISLTGAQVGIVTEAEHTRARILDIAPDRVKRHLQEGKVVVVAGFQGVSATGDRDITTLGRGGSDTSAVALAAALKASACEIYTDVPGILTTDPRIVPEAKLLTEITADEMLELASLGAKVLHPRAVEIAKNYGVPLVVRSSWTDDPGTWVVSPVPAPRPLTGLEIARSVDAVGFTTDQAKIALLQVPDRAGIAGQLFGALARERVDVDLIVQSIHEGNTNDIAFTVHKHAIGRAQAVAEAISPVLHDNFVPSHADILVADDIAKVSISGAGMIGRPGVAAKMFRILADAGINIQMISTSEIKISCTIASKDCDRAIAALCQQFEISTSANENNLAPVTAPAVRGVSLDLDRARLAILQVPDRPGMAAELFGILAANNISLDAIVQSQRTRVINGVATRDIACTVAQNDAADAKRVLEASATQLGCGAVVVDESIAKVSIVGAGMVSNPGVAAKMFSALAEAKINIQMISTSEIKISCVVARSQGIDALKTVHRAFGLG